MAFFRTSTMAGVSKKHTNGKGAKGQVNRSETLKVVRGGLGNTGNEGRRHTMLPQRQPTRDSVLSNGSSDRSSCVSDETFLSPPLPEPACYRLR